jgi:hypothetical protein
VAIFKKHSPSSLLLELGLPVSAILNEPRTPIRPPLPAFASSITYCWMVSTYCEQRLLITLEALCPLAIDYSTVVYGSGTILEGAATSTIEMVTMLASDKIGRVYD